MFDPLRWLTTISSIIKSNNPDIDTSVGTVVGDTVVLPLSVLYEKIDVVSKILLDITNIDSLVAAIDNAQMLADTAVALETTPTEIQALLTTILENIAADYGLTRLEATAATGTVYYVLKTLPNYDGTYTITQADRIQSVFNYWYRPTQTFAFTIDSTDINKTIERYYVSSLSAYAFPVVVQGETPGAASTVSAGQIYFTALGTPTNYAYVTNLTDISGGRDRETNQELAERIKKKWEGSNAGTKGGYRTAMATHGVVDTYVAGIGDPYMVRDTEGGAVDLYIRNYQGISTTVTDVSLASSVYPNFTEYLISDLMNTNNFSLTLPVHEVIGTIVTGSPAFYVIKLKPDTGETYRKSSRALDKILVATSDGSTNTYNLQFIYNYYIDTLQKVFSQDDQHVLGQDPLMREGLAKPIKIAFTVKSTGFVSLSGLAATIKNSIISYLQNLRMGSSISQSDIINFVEDIPGVDIVYVPFTKFNYRNDTGPALTTLTAKEIEYLQIGSFGFPNNLKAIASSGGNLGNSTTYYYTVIAEDVDGNLTKSLEVAQTTGPAGAENNHTITVSWDTIPDAVKYTVWRSTTAGSYTKRIIMPPTVGPIITSLIDNGLQDETAIMPDIPEATVVPLIEITVR